MSKTAKTLKTLKAGDIVKATVTLRAKSDGVDGEGFATFVDVQDYDQQWELAGGGSLQIEMVKRVSRRPKQRQDFKPGDIISGQTVNDVMWRRGTILGHVYQDRGRWVLHYDGLWHSLDYGCSFEFREFSPAMNYRIVYLP